MKYINYSISYKVLLSHDEILQLSGVQCVTSVISQHTQYVQSLLTVDIAGNNSYH